MTKDNEFRIRPGPIRSKSAQRIRPFVHQALASAQKAGATVTRGQIRSSRHGFGRGRAATISANRLLTNRSRQAVIKARVVRHRGGAAPLKAHLRYLQREGVTRDGDKARLFGPGSDSVDGPAFAENAADDRHQFRFIVSPDDALQMDDLKAFTRDLMKQAEHDLGTKLDWVGVAHWNTEHPHVHVVVRGKTDLGEDLVISRDYIKEGMRARAQHLITNELGERTDFDIRQSLHRQIEAERFTQLDRQLLSDQRRVGFVDLAPPVQAAADDFQVLKAGRMRKLETLGLANQFAPGQWVVSDSAPTVLKELGERDDIIKRIHRGLTEAGLERATSSYVLGGEQLDRPVVGRLMDRGLDDELRGSAYAVIDGVDGRIHHVKLPSLDAAGDSIPGSIVELRRGISDDGYDRSRLVIWSDMSIEQQVSANGATWLDRTAISGRASVGSAGFGADVHDALRRRGEHLVGEGLAKEAGDGFSFSRNLLQTLRQRELNSEIKRLSDTTGRAYLETAPGEYAMGTYRQRVNLASGRFAVLDDGMGFRMVPWSSSIENKLGQHISGVMRSNGTIGWDLGRARGMDIGL